MPKPRPPIMPWIILGENSGHMITGLCLWIFLQLLLPEVHPEMSDYCYCGVIRPPVRPIVITMCPVLASAMAMKMKTRSWLHSLCFKLAWSLDLRALILGHSVANGLVYDHTTLFPFMHSVAGSNCRRRWKYRACGSDYPLFSRKGKLTTISHLSNFHSWRDQAQKVGILSGKFWCSAHTGYNVCDLCIALVIVSAEIELNVCCCLMIIM